MIIKTPSRLHMTLIDLNGSYGRADGGIGLTLADPNFSLKSELSDNGVMIDFDSEINSNEIKSECIKKITSSAEKTMSYYNIDGGFHFTVKKAYLPHSGLGSGTQISLATSKLVYEHLKEDNSISTTDSTFDKDISSVELGKITGRGGTSGIGIFSFDYGGFILDGGHNLKEKGTFLPSAASPAKPPHLLGIYDFPEEWDIIVAIPRADTSVTGQKEVDIFTEYCPVPKQDVEKLSHLILMNLLPFLLEKNIECFGKSIDQIQNLGFKKVEVNLQSDIIKSAMANMREAGAYGVGMSSFGPSIYGITEGNTKEVFKATKEFIGENGDVFITKAQNTGYELQR
ncbi:beta-ribofuranosylaminobenzene 5'-phosphate synthase [Methanobrevibacter filiformis]|nr:beta-ribofuranosylaminobenzene 5'-phosphate synthase [Methanobrevibacter filiformis]